MTSCALAPAEPPALVAARRLDRQFGALERLQPSDEQQHRPGWQPDCRARGVSLTWREHGPVHAGCQHVNSLWRYVVQRSELARLRVSRGEHGVRAIDDTLLGLAAVARLGIAGARLDAAQRVKGDGQRDIEAVLQHMSGQAAQPVVSVDCVDWPPSEVLADPISKRCDDREQVVLVERWSAGVDVGDAQPRLDFDVVRLRRIGATGVDVAIDAKMGQRGGELTHVHVQAAAVAAAWLVERRGVHAQHRDSRDATRFARHLKIGSIGGHGR